MQFSLFITDNMRLDRVLNYIINDDHLKKFHTQKT